MKTMATNPRAAIRHQTAAFILTAAVVLAMALFAIPTVAMAQDIYSCEATVMDASGELDVDRIQNTILASAPDGVRFVVRGFDTVPDGDLEAAVNEVVLNCYSDDVADIDPTTIMLSVSVGDRLSDLWVGKQWLNPVGDVEGIRSDVMGEQFSSGDFTAGFVDAIEVISERIETSQAAADSSGASDDGQDGSSTGAVGTDDAVETPGGSSSPSTSSGPSPVAVAGGVALLGLGAGGAFAFNRRRKIGAAREALQSAMAGPQVRVGALRQRHDEVMIKADLWEKVTAGRSKTSLQELSASNVAASQGTERSAALLAAALPNGVGDAQQSEIDAAKQRLVDLARALDTHAESMDRLFAFGAHLDHLRVAVPAKQELLAEEVVAALAFADQRASEGWAVEGQVKELKRVQQVATELDFSDLEQDWLELSDTVEGAEATLFAAEHYLQALPSRVESLKKWESELTAARDLELARAEDSRRRFASLATVHAGDSWQWAADYPEKAAASLQSAAQLQDQVMTELIPQQHFDEAGRQLEAAGLHVIAADEFLDQMEDLMVDLEQARQEAAGIVAQSREILEDLARFIIGHDDDLDDHYNERPSQFARVIDGLDLELRQIKPNFLRVAETGYQINRQMDELLASAKDDQAEMAALRREAVREIARAERALARARRSLGWELIQSRTATRWTHSKRSCRPCPIIRRNRLMWPARLPMPPCGFRSESSPAVDATAPGSSLVAAGEALADQAAERQAAASPVGAVHLAAAGLLAADARSEVVGFSGGGHSFGGGRSTGSF